jgi:hypothetical protein
MTVFEDDAECLRPSALKNIPFGKGSFEVLLLGGVYDDRAEEYREGSAVAVQKVKRFLCTHAYVIWKEAAWKLLQFALPIQKQVDFYMHSLPSIEISACVPAIFLQNQAIAHTDIQIPLREVSEDRIMWYLLTLIISVWFLVCLVFAYMVTYTRGITL